ncbi:hypothetical protein ABKN59_008015 [Abortiporus biennis]
MTTPLPPNTELNQSTEQNGARLAEPGSSSSVRRHTKSSISELSSVLNARTSISTFPPEVLAEVLLHCARLHDEEEVKIVAKLSIQHYRWLYITQISHRWRAIALDTPRLWARIGANVHPRLLEEVFRRSKEAPVDIYAYLGSKVERVQKFIELFRRNISRVRSLDFRLHRCRITPGNLENMARAPLLRSFLLANIHGEEGKESPMTTLFSTDMPLLNHIEIYSTSFVFNKVYFLPTLTYVRLSAPFVGSNNPRGRGPSWDALKEVLTSLPLLEDLYLDNIFPYVPPNSVLPSGHNPTILPRVKFLHIMGGGFQVAHFFRRIFVPASATFDIYVKTLDDEQELLEIFEPTFRMRFHPSQNPDFENETPFLTFAARYTSPLALRLRLWTEVIPDTYLGLEIPDLVPKLSINIETTTHNPTNIMEVIIPDLVVEEVESLSLDGLTEVSISIWTNVLVRMSKLKTIRLTEQAGEFLPEVLTANHLKEPPILPGECHTLRIFPHVKTIIFENVNMMQLPRGRTEGNLRCVSTSGMLRFNE